jgi:hypothetical protein
VKKVVVVILGLMLFCCGDVVGQKYDYHWMLGYIGSVPNSFPLYCVSNLDFNTVTLSIQGEARTVSMAAGAGNICDKFGQLQFYTNGFEMRNRNDQTMPNGQGLNPGIIATTYNGYGDNYPISHGPIILPDVTTDSVYYVFHCGLEPDTIDGAPCKYLYYTQVDMRLQNGLGDVKFKNKILLDGNMIPGGGMAACKHGNGRDWWITIQEKNSNCFYTCLLSPNGVDSVSKQCIGDTMHWNQGRGSNVFTPDGSKYIWSSPYFEHLNILDFDRCTGLFSNHRRYRIIDSMVRFSKQFFLMAWLFLLIPNIYISLPALTLDNLILKMIVLKPVNYLLKIPTQELP